MTKLQQRKDNLMPNGIPKWIRCYDGGENFTDRYQVVFTHTNCFGIRGRVPILGMSGSPYHTRKEKLQCVVAINQI